MTPLTPVKAAWYRIRAQRLEREVGHLMHRFAVADPYGAHPDTVPALSRLAQDGVNANAIVRALTAYLEAPQ
jgi:hypothetical protein